MVKVKVMRVNTRCKIQEPFWVLFSMIIDEMIKQNIKRMNMNMIRRIMKKVVIILKWNLWIVERKRLKQATIISLRPTAVIITLLSN